MSSETKLDIWVQLARGKYPMLSEDIIKSLSMTAASEWYLNTNSELAELYDQYVMLKTLKGILPDGNE